MDREKWSLCIDDELREAVRKLHHKPSTFDKFLPKPHRRKNLGLRLAVMLQEGITGMDKEGSNWLDLELF